MLNQLIPVALGSHDSNRPTSLPSCRAPQTFVPPTQREAPGSRSQQLGQLEISTYQLSIWEVNGSQDMREEYGRYMRYDESRVIPVNDQVVFLRIGCEQKC